MKQHERTENCWCSPTVIPVECQDGTFVWVYAHHEGELAPEEQAERAAMIFEAMGRVRYREEDYE